MTEPTRRVVLIPLGADGTPRGEPLEARASSIHVTWADGSFTTPPRPLSWRGSATVEFNNVGPDLYHLISGAWPPGTPRRKRAAWAVKQWLYKVRGKWRG